MTRKDSTPPLAHEKKPNRRRKRGARGVLWVVITMLAASGALRVGNETGWAIAKGSSEFSPAVKDNATPECTPPPDIATVLALLRKREKVIAKKEAAIADRATALSAAEQLIKQRLDDLKQTEKSLQATMARSRTANEDDLARLTTVYESMKPKDAAPLFSAMTPDFAAGFLGRMRPESAAAILAKLDPETGYSISVLLAGRNASAPTQ